MIGRQRQNASPPSIFEHIRAHIPEEGPGLSPGGETLPDEGDGDEKFMWAPGAHDGVLTHHWGGSGDPEEVRRLSTALTDAVSASKREARAAYEALYETARGITIVPVVDGVLTGVRSSGVDPEDCYRLAHRLATEGGHREPVKLGIALLGLFDAGHHRDELMILGRHDEFTLFAAVALGNRDDDGAEAELWELARQVRGWGRVHLVERLSDTADPRIREWILRDGFRNEVMDAYLAGIAAETGGLADALSGDPDDELLYAAGDILTALSDDGGPVQGMPGYADGKRAASLFLDHMSARAADLRHFLAVQDVRGYAEREWPELAARCTEIMDRPLWADLARRGLASEDPAEFRRAAHVCRTLGVPTLRAHLDRLRTRDPFDSADWFGAVGQAGPDSIDEVLALAVELLPLDEIATGPADEMGVGERFAPHRCLDTLLQDLGGRPGRGVPLVIAGLASPVVRNRNMAVRALDGWGRDAWPEGAGDAVAAALAREPDESVRGRLQALLDGRPID
ncbi:hypothetical protein [Actinomadura rugatobispora]|uniref:Limonene hydroxylase n=1 Tax=Actinomadura rugatobispora TaxID=1994 RepID=A0ABW1A4I2_9ACTN|nr:hypothetical protein GCM10010200_007900 [Actinomadura rugatobispora]